MKKCRSDSKDELKNAHKLRENLNISKIKLKSKKQHRFPTDLIDLYAVCAACKHLIEQLTEEENWTDTAKLREIIFDLDVQLFTHLVYHYEPLKKSLDKIYRQITTEKESENDLKKILETARKMLGKSKKKKKFESLSSKPNISGATENKKTKKSKLPLIKKEKRSR